jgi:DNA-binding transcriptional regulator YiaG
MIEQPLDRSGVGANAPAMSKLQTMTADDLRAARAEMGLTQVDAANLYNISLSGYKKWELGERKIEGPAVPLTKYLLASYRKKEKK